MELVDVAPGFYPGLSYDEYDRIRGLNWSVLRRFKKSAAHARSEQIEPPEPSEEMEEGNALHTMLLEPGRFTTDYVIVPEEAPTRRSNAGKAWWEEFERATAGKTRLTSDQLERIQRWRDSVYTNALATELLNDPRALKECVIVWDDPEFEVRCKGRIDLAAPSQGRSIVADVKTTIDAGPWWFGKALDDYDWAGQIMWYTDGLQTVRPLQGAERIPYFIAVEKKAPFCTVVYELGQSSREVARQQARRYMQRWVEAERQGFWPGYPDAVIELPVYVLNRVD